VTRWWTLAMALAACSGPDDATKPPRSTGLEPTDSGTPGTTEPTPTLEGVTDAAASLDEAYPSLVRVSWSQDEALTVHLEYSFDDGVWLRSPARDLGAGPHEELLLGVPYATDVTWRIVAQSEATPDQTTRTADAPEAMPRAELRVLDAAAVDPATTHVLVSVNEGEVNGTGSWTMLMDRLGRVSWAHRSPAGRHTMHPRVTWRGDAFLIDHSSFFTEFDGGAASEILELKIDGTEVRRWATPGQHHAFTDFPEGSALAGSLAYAQYQGAGDGDPADDDAVVILDPAGGSRQLFGCAGFLAGLSWGGPTPGIGEDGWCGSNTLSYDPQLDVFLFSLFTHDSVVEVDAVTGEANRWFGRIAGSWAFDPPESEFDYQHGAIYLEGGNLLVSTHSSRDTTELAVREYALDAADQALVEVWSAGVGLGVPGRQKGEAHRLPNGNTLQNFGTHAMIREFAPDGAVVWDIRWEAQEYQGDDAHGMGRSAPVQVDLYAFAPARP
jgi:hypothetical protein